MFMFPPARLTALVSLPVRGAWVEIRPVKQAPLYRESLPVRGAWVEMLDLKKKIARGMSLPVRGAWVEII